MKRKMFRFRLERTFVGTVYAMVLAVDEADAVGLLVAAGFAYILVDRTRWSVEECSGQIVLFNEAPWTTVHDIRKGECDGDQEQRGVVPGDPSTVEG